MAVLLYQSSQKPVSHPITRLLVTTLAFFKQFLIVKKKKKEKKKQLAESQRVQFKISRLYFSSVVRINGVGVHFHKTTSLIKHIAGV